MLVSCVKVAKLTVLIDVLYFFCIAHVPCTGEASTQGCLNNFHHSYLPSTRHYAHCGKFIGFSLLLMTDFDNRGVFQFLRTIRNLTMLPSFLTFLTLISKCFRNELVSLAMLTQEMFWALSRLVLLLFLSFTRKSALCFNIAGSLLAKQISSVGVWFLV